MIRITQHVQTDSGMLIPQSFSITENYSQYIANLSTRLSFNDLLIVKNLYGLFEDLKLSIDSFKLIDDGTQTYEFKLKVDIIGEMLFGDEDNFLDCVEDTDLTVLAPEEFLTSILNEEYKEVLIKIYKLSVK